MADLHTAARNNEVGQLQLLLAKGADINSRDKHSRTPLHLAAWAGKLEAVKALLAAKCNAGASALDDTTALHFAAQKGFTEVCRQLLHAGDHEKTSTRQNAVQELSGCIIQAYVLAKHREAGSNAVHTLLIYIFTSSYIIQEQVCKLERTW